MLAEHVGSQPVVRPARAEDAAEIARIYVASSNLGFGELMPRRHVTDELVARWRQDLAMPAPHRWWVAELAGTIAGFAGIGPSRDPIDPGLGELDTIAVDPPHWRRGVGRALMAVALQQLAADGYREALLWTLAGYPRGQAFYQATGWSWDGGARNAGSQLRYRHALDENSTT